MTIRAAVPAYFHPSWAANDWTRLYADESGSAIRIVVINPDSGPGTIPDDAYRSTCTLLRRRGQTVAGYVDTAYATRPVGDVAMEVSAYRRMFGVSSVFIDRVTSGCSGLKYYRVLAEMLRNMRVDKIVFNPGCMPESEYFSLADVVVTFEGSEASYREAGRPKTGWCPRGATTWHLVYSAPRAELIGMVQMARARGATFVYVTERSMPNPWDRLPARWSALVEALAMPDRHSANLE